MNDRTGSGLDWAALYERHSRELAAFAYRLLDDAGAAREVVGDTFARAIRREHTLHVPEAPRAWLYRLAAELVREHRRRRAIAARIPLLTPPVPADPLDDAAPIRRALGAIPTDQAIALLLAEVGFARDEIAEITDSGEEDVAARIEAGRAALAAASRRPGDAPGAIDEDVACRALRAPVRPPPLLPFDEIGRRASSRSLPVLQAGVLAAVLVVAAIVGLRLPELRQALEPGPTPSPVALTTLSLLAERDMVHFAAHDGALLATSFTAGPPRRSQLHRALPPEGRWEKVHETDANITLGGPRGWAISGSRVAFVEQRSEPDGTDVRRVVIVNLDQQVARTTVVDEFLLTPAAAPIGGHRRGVVEVVVGPRAVAWTRLIEERSLDGRRPSSITTELRLAAAHLPTASVLVAAHAVPIGFSEGGLVYARSPGGGGREIRFRDGLTGADRPIYSEPSDPSGGPARTLLWTSVVAGPWVVWRHVVDPPTEPAPRGALRAVSVRTGELRELGALEPGCGAPTAGERYVAVACSTRTLLFDARTLAPTTHPTPLPPAQQGRATASGDGLLVQQPDGGGRRVVYHRPVPPPPVAAPSPTPVTLTPRPTCAPEPAERRIRELIAEFNRQDPAAIRHIDLWARGGNHSTFSVTDARQRGAWRPEIDFTRRIDVQRYLVQRYAQQEQLVLREITHRVGGWDREGLVFHLTLERSARDLDPSPTEASVSVEIRCPHGTIESWQMFWGGPSPFRH